MSEARAEGGGGEAEGGGRRPSRCEAAAAHLVPTVSADHVALHAQHPPGPHAPPRPPRAPASARHAPPATPPGLPPGPSGRLPRAEAERQGGRGGRGARGEPMSRPAEVLEVARAAARAGGARAAAGLGRARQVSRKGAAASRDLVTEVDLEVQKIVQKEITVAYPEHAFLGEEGCGVGAAEELAAAAGDNWLWVVDPIDGTTNFVHGTRPPDSCPAPFSPDCRADNETRTGLPLCSVSIAACRNGLPAVGVVYDPERDELFEAVEGGGAWLNGARLHVSSEVAAADALVATGYGASAEATAPFLKGMQALTALPVRSVRMLGSACIMLAWVAAGRLEAYYEADLNPWDTAAGALLVREAGGCVTDLAGAEYGLGTRPILASNRSTHDELLGALQRGGCRGLA